MIAGYSKLDTYQVYIRSLRKKPKQKTNKAGYLARENAVTAFQSVLPSSKITIHTIHKNTSLDTQCNVLQLHALKRQ